MCIRDSNTLGAENTLAGQLGHVDLLCMGHHGFYGSNTPGYMDALSPDLLILPGNVQAVSAVGTRSTYTILKELSQNGCLLYTSESFIFIIKNQPDRIVCIGDRDVILECKNRSVKNEKGRVKI